MIIVESKCGGWVKADCIECLSEPTNCKVLEETFRSLNIIVDCPKCKERMTSGKLENVTTDYQSSERKNYGFSCKSCKLYVWLSQIVPHYSEQSLIQSLRSTMRLQ